jgi:6-phosphogluconolactonase
MAVVRVYGDAEALSRAGAELFAERAMASVAEHGRFVVLLAGGSTPRRAYQLLAEAPLASRVPWPDCHFFWGDERCLPAGHELRNETMVRRALLDHLFVPPSQIHPIRYHQEPERAASEYEAELRRFFAGQPPRFDLILLGLGDDGHTASLLPGSAALHEQVHWTAVTRRPEEPFSRVTLTAPLLNQGASTVFLVGGQGKAPVLQSILNGSNDALTLPAQHIRPQHGELLWLVDREAASQLEEGYGAG